MSKTEKLIPKDSEQRPVQAEQATDGQKGDRYRATDAGMRNPATKRKYSEQPPTKRNAKT